ncbi:MAG: GWxTD domain-containing protein [bacterium]
MFRKVLLISIQAAIIFHFTPEYKSAARSSPIAHLQITASTPDSILSEKDYLQVLQRADNEIFAKDFEPYFLLILDPEQKATYDSLGTLDARKSYIVNYWKASNPNPLLPENDWLLDFIQRVDYSKKNFASPKPPYIDDRGWYYIRFGKPRSRWQDSGGIVNLEASNNKRMRDFFGIRNPISYTIASNETWSYANIHRDFVVYFKKEGNTFREIKDLKKLIDDRIDVRQIRTNDPYKIYWFWGDLVKKRASLSPVLGEAYSKVMQAEENVIMRVMAHEPPHVTLWRGESDVTRAIEKARIEMPAAAHDPVQAESTLKLYDRISQFRGHEDSEQTRIEIALLSPYKKNLVRKFNKSTKDTIALHFGSMLRDSTFETIAVNRMQSTVRMKLAVQEKLPNAVSKLILTAQPQKEAELTVQVQKSQRKQKERFGFYRQTIDILDFSARDMQISDIRLSYHVRVDRQQQLLPFLQSDGLPVSPYPYRKIRKRSPPLFYFEIYNIPASGSDEMLEISYTLFELKDQNKSEASVSATYTRRVTESNMQEMIEVDLKNVKKGRHLLEVAVRLLQAPEVYATAVREIKVE